MEPIIVNGYNITESKKPFIVAEIGVNYYDIAKKMGLGLVEAAKLMIKEAKWGGAQAVKFQTYKANKIASRFSPAYWDLKKEPTTSQYELFKKFDQFDDDEWMELASYSKKEKITFMSTPFDFEAVDILDEIMPVFKISSSDITNLPFIKYIAGKGKPIFLSTGASTISEIYDAVSMIKEQGNNKVVVMHCILSYPTSFDDANLNMIRHLRDVFKDDVVGYSDHVIPDESMMVLTMSYLLGAKVIEKHFTLDKNLVGNDHYHAMDVDDLKRFNRNIELITRIEGSSIKAPVESEMNSRKYARRSIVAKNTIPEGTIIENTMLEFKRPGTGVSPSMLELVLGRTAKKTIKKDEIITWDYLV